MRRVLLICLSLVLALGGWSAVGAEDGFYVIGGGGKSASVPKTGQTETYGTRDDGALQKGVAWPTPRFTDNGNGTVTDNLTRLIWTKNAQAFIEPKQWAGALTVANSLASGSYGLTDGSKPGDWRLPNIRELQSLVDLSKANPALPDNHPFTNVQAYYWSSNTLAFNTDYAWSLTLNYGMNNSNHKLIGYDVWCVRGGP